MEGDDIKMRYRIEDEDLASIVSEAKDFAFCNGLGMRSKELPTDAITFASFCLFPSPFPKKWFDFALELQPHINSILHAIAYSKDFLRECLAETIEADEFVKNIFHIYEETFSESKLSLGVVRSDYLLHTDSDASVIGLRQVESNTIAASFGGLAPTLTHLHQFVLEKIGQKELTHKCPPNESVHLLARGIVAAWDAYDQPESVVLVVVEEVTLNMFDQRALEYAVKEHGVSLLRRSFAQMRGGKVEITPGGALILEGKWEVGVVYFRTGYVPEDYPEQADWATRLTLERSRAVCCPSAGLQLAGTKRVQQHLTRPGVLERFVDSKRADGIRGVFAPQYVIDGSEAGASAVQLGIDHPEDFVLKPEREGGGHNVYGADVRSALEKGVSGHILMGRIRPPHAPNCIVTRGGAPYRIQEVVAELGVFGTVLGDSECVSVNRVAGHLLRSKAASSDECGVAAGFGALDSPLLV